MTTAIGHDDALRMLAAAVIGDRTRLRDLVHRLLFAHHISPAAAAPRPGKTGDGQHCHCACPVCECGQPMCGGPCPVVGVMLDELVLRDAPRGAVDVDRTLERLHHDAVRRIVENTTRDVFTYVEPATHAGQPAWRVVTTDPDARDDIRRALEADGYRCQPTEPNVLITTRRR